MRTSLPKSSVSHDWFPESVARPASDVSPCAFSTAPEVSFTDVGRTTREAGARLKASHGPSGAAHDAREAAEKAFRARK